jgi:hypothetical protein
MTQVEILDAARGRDVSYKVETSRGEHIGRVSSEWCRPTDERYLSLSDLFAAVRGRTERSHTRTVESAAIRVKASRDDAERLFLAMRGSDRPVAMTHWSFSQLASLVGTPAAYLRQLPAPLAGINLQDGLTSHRAEQVKTLETENGRVELRAVTGPDYGRIYDHELVSAVQRIAGDGVGDTRWKVPGVLDWSTGIYNPNVRVTEETTTLYASDRDVFLFLVDDLNPIEAGRLPDGSPDLFFRGFYCWNSEVGAKTLGIASFYLRAVCQNRKARRRFVLKGAPPMRPSCEQTSPSRCGNRESATLAGAPQSVNCKASGQLPESDHTSFQLARAWTDLLQITIRRLFVTAP